MESSAFSRVRSLLRYARPARWTAILAGIVQSVFGYVGVFIAACLFTIPGTLTLLFIPLDEAEAPRVGAAAGGH